MARSFALRRSLVACAFCCSLLAASIASAVDITGVQAAALDQPQINVLLRTSPTSSPLEADFGIDGSTICIQAYFDTGASGILLSRDTAEAMKTSAGLDGVVRSTSGGTPVTFYDVGVSGLQPFDVSEPLYVGLESFGTGLDTENPTNYNQTFGPVRVQINRDYALSPTLAVDVVGTPAMAGKVVVIDPRPVENIFDFLQDPSWETLNLDIQSHTFVYDPGTAFNPASATSPGIPTTNRHVKLSYGDFEQFTQMTPSTAEGPTLHANPFIGANPVAQLSGTIPASSPPGVTISLGDLSTTGSFLLDTGAAASMISSKLAASLHVRDAPGTEGTANPVLETFDPDHPLLPGTALSDQFSLTVTGIGGDTKVAGFFLDSLVVPTMEAGSSSADDPNNLRYLSAPVLVSDISMQDPTTLQTLTLDGVFGMNFLSASVEVFEGDLASFGATAPGAFNWIVFDEPNGVLGLDLKSQDVPEPSTLVMVAIAALALWRRRSIFGKMASLV